MWHYILIISCKIYYNSSCRSTAANSNGSEPDVREHVAQIFPGVVVVLGPEEHVDRPQRVPGHCGGRVVGSGVGRPEPSVHALAELEHALWHHVARTVLELFGTDECSHVRPRGRRVAHHAAHGRHARAAGLAHGLMELVRHYVVADHVARNRSAVTVPSRAVPELLDHLIGGGFAPDPFERFRVHQFGQRAGQHLRPIHHKCLCTCCGCVCVCLCLCVCVFVSLRVFVGHACLRDQCGRNICCQLFISIYTNMYNLNFEVPLWSILLYRCYMDMNAMCIWYAQDNLLKCLVYWLINLKL